MKPAEAVEATDTALISLLPESRTRRSILEQLVREIDEFWERVPEIPIGPIDDAQCRAEWLARFDFAVPADLASLASEVLARVERGTLLTQQPGYFGLFNPAPAFPGVVGEFITAAINPQLAAASHAPLAAEIEQHVIKSVCARIGWSTVAAGHFTTGGAEANMTSALLALTAGEPRFGDVGSSAYKGQAMLYTSKEAHLAWFKIAHQLGIGRTAVQLVATDGSGRIDTEALEDVIKSDIVDGKTPVMVAATAGTTGAGMIDPLSACAKIARAYGMWLHVDAAWAGALVASDGLRQSLAGIEQADSVTIDAHKWFSVPMGAGMFLTRRPEVLADAFRVTTTYMPAPTVIDDPYTHSAQWSRRSIGLKFFMTLAALGWRGYAELVEQQIALAADLREALKAKEWNIENDSPAAVVCFTDKRDRDPAAIVEMVQARQRSWVSVALFEGKPVIRACVTNFRTRRSDVDQLVDELCCARINH